MRVLAMTVSGLPRAMVMPPLHSGLPLPKIRSRSTWMGWLWLMPPRSVIDWPPAPERATRALLTRIPNPMAVALREDRGRCNSGAERRLSDSRHFRHDDSARAPRELCNVPRTRARTRSRGRLHLSTKIADRGQRLGCPRGAVNVASWIHYVGRQ